MGAGAFVAERLRLFYGVLFIETLTREPRAGYFRAGFFGLAYVFLAYVLLRPGGDLLSHDYCRSIIGAAALNGRVRDGIGCFARAMATRSEEDVRGMWFWASVLASALLVDVFSKFVIRLLARIKPIGRLVPVN